VNAEIREQAAQPKKKILKTGAQLYLNAFNLPPEESASRLTCGTAGARNGSAYICSEITLAGFEPGLEKTKVS